MDEEWRFKAHELIKRLSVDLVHSMGGEIELHIDVGYPCVMNDISLNNAAMGKAEEYLGKENVSETELRMGAEDFGYYAQQVPACFYRLGTMNAAVYEQRQTCRPDIVGAKAVVAIRIGGAIFCDCRYEHVFTYHNGADSYYAARGFRGSLRV